jgi:hypothetical protein
MKKIFFLNIFISSFCYSQSNTEIYIFDLIKIGDKTDLQKSINVSNNNGYNIQPTFYDQNTVIFATSRNGKTDITL